jgi:hypothetical protein
MSDVIHAARATQKQGSNSGASRYSDALIAYTILRISFGINFMLHGVSRLLADHANFVAYHCLSVLSGHACVDDRTGGGRNVKI